MRIGFHEYANEADDDDVPKPAQSLGTPVPRQKFKKKMKRIDAIKKGETRSQIDTIIHNSSLLSI